MAEQINCYQCGNLTTKNTPYTHLPFGGKTRYFCCKRCKDEYKKGDTTCFITTATLQHKGIFDDNCFELQEFRRLRDTYVQTNHPEYVAEYYQIAPKIVENINKLKDNAKQFSDIWNNYLKNCLSKTVENNLEDATIVYKKMVDDLKIKFLETENNQINNFKCHECGSTDPKKCLGGSNICPYT